MTRPLSMTAFGRGESSDGARSWTIEVRSVNHRFCDISVKMAREYAGLEERIKKVIGAFYSRGRIDAFLTVKGEDPTASLASPNLPYARQYYESLLAIGRELGLNEQPGLAVIAANKDIILKADITEDLDKIWPSVQKALHESLEMGLAMRAAEGAALKKELLERLTLFAGMVSALEQKIPLLVLAKEKALRERLTALSKELALDPVRFAQEAAILAEKSDITEEIVRLKSHIDQFRVFFDLDEPVGRRLDFLLQEFLREINTVASKMADAAAAHLTVEMKNEVEKLREQVQNIE